MNTGKIEAMTKRGYSRDFTPRTERRVRIEVDRVPPALYDKVSAKAKREGVSLRALVLQLLTEWVEQGRRKRRKTPEWSICEAHSTAIAMCLECATRIASRRPVSRRRQ